MLVDEEESCGNSVISLIFAHNRLGISHFCEELNGISTDGLRVTLEDFEDLVQSLKRTYSPSLFLLHPRIAANAVLLNIITEAYPESSGVYSFKIMKSCCWNFHYAIDLMTNKLNVRDMYRNGETHVSGQEKYISYSSAIDLDNIESIASLGALMTYLQESVMTLESGMMYVSTITPMSIESYMRLPAATIKALQIFQEDYHPNVIKGTGRSKEGYSIFTLLDRTSSNVGKECLRQWMARPLYDREKIISRQDNIEVLMKPENMDFVAKSSALLKKVYDMPKLILRIKKVAATQKEWCKLLGAMAAALLIFEEMSHFYNSTVNSMDKRFALEFLASADVEVVRNTYSTLHEAVDISSSISAGELVIMSGFSKELDEITLLYDNLERCLTDAARRILHAFPLLNHIAVEYVPQIGYLAVIDMADSNLVYADEFKLIYELNEKGYYKCSACFQLDDEIGDIKGTLNDTRKKIFLALEEVLIEAESSIVDMSLSIGALDAIISLTKVAVEMKFSRPEIVQDSVIIIKNGLHPLVQLAVDAYVPNDTYMTPEMNIALITGENGSGKSVYIKQVGVLVYLAHIGSWIPCEKAIIGLTDKIITRVASVESSFSPHSAFSLDISQMNHVINEHTSRTLCLVDEFGKGTSPIDGMALLSSCIEFFSQREAKALFVLHFTEIFQVLEITSLTNVSVFKMVVHDEHGSNKDNSEFATPLFKLKLGISKSSGGLNCAKSAGIKYDITSRADIIVECLSNRTNIPVARSRKSHIIQETCNLEILSNFFLLTEELTSPTRRQAALSAIITMKKITGASEVKT